jgi:hypothetical protein
VGKCEESSKNPVGKMRNSIGYVVKTPSNPVGK